MTEERYEEISSLIDYKNEEFNKISEEEFKEFNNKRYLKITDQKDALDGLLAQIETAQQGYQNVWATGFSQLDEKLDGGFLGGNLIGVGAVSSLGKTTFVLQIADQMAALGKDVLIFSLEMSKNELNAKSISRNTYRLTEPDIYKTLVIGDGFIPLDSNIKLSSWQKQEYRVTMGDVLRGRVGYVGEDKRKLFDEALAITQKLSEHIYIIRNNEVNLDFVADMIQCHEDVTGQKPFVMIDYLQILKPREGSQTKDKRLLTDEDVNGLKDLAVRKDLPILIVSAFNRTNYLEPVSMGSFKESGGIDYTCDTVIGLQYSGMQYQKHYIKKNEVKKIVFENKQAHESRVRQLFEKMDSDGAEGKSLPIDVVLLKNRGIAKGKLLFEFCPKYNIFREKKDQNAEPYSWNHDEDEIEVPFKEDNRTENEIKKNWTRKEV